MSTDVLNNRFNGSEAASANQHVCKLSYTDSLYSGCFSFYFEV